MTALPRPPHHPDGLALGRRRLLGLGAAVLLSGCGAPGRDPFADPSPRVTPSGPSTGPSGAPSVTPSSGPLDSPSPLPSPSRSSGPGPGCQVDPGVIVKPGTLQYVSCDGMDIALTIDDGPDPRWTPQILDLLAKYDVKATFCVIGENAARNRGLVARAADGGHQIANHTYTHPLNLATLSRAKVDDQIHRTAELLALPSGGRPGLFRAPGGAWSGTILESCRDADLRPLDWSVDTRDWTRPGSKQIVDAILTHTHPGSIILDHDGGGNRAQTVEALGIALPRLLDQGYRFVLP